MQSFSFNIPYQALLAKLLNEVDRGHSELNTRTGSETVSLPYGAESFILDVKNFKVPVPGNRKVYLATAAAEIAWFLKGTQDITWLQQFNKIWDNFVEADELTVLSAYGYRWRKHFGRDQILLACKQLKKEPSSRQVLISTWDPASDGLGNKAKNIPCPTHFTLSITHGLLNSSLFIRSSDVFVGLPYDVMGHCLLIHLIAKFINIEAGYIHFTLAQPHLYEKHFDMARESLNTVTSTLPFIAPDFSLSDVLMNPEVYVKATQNLQKEYFLKNLGAYNPKPEIVI